MSVSVSRFRADSHILLVGRRSVERSALLGSRLGSNGGSVVSVPTVDTKIIGGIAADCSIEFQRNGDPIAPRERRNVKSERKLARAELNCALGILARAETLGKCSGDLDFVGSRGLRKRDIPSRAVADNEDDVTCGGFSVAADVGVFLKESVHVPTDIFAYEKHDILCIYVAVAVHVAHHINLRAVGDDPYLGELQSASRGNKAVVRKNAFTVGCDYVNTTAAYKL